MDYLFGFPMGLGGEAHEAAHPCAMIPKTSALLSTDPFDFTLHILPPHRNYNLPLDWIIFPPKTYYDVEHMLEIFQKWIFSI